MTSINLYNPFLIPERCQLLAGKERKIRKMRTTKHLKTGPFDGPKRWEDITKVDLRVTP
jgi:hypothetical protein